MRRRPMSALKRLSKGRADRLIARRLPDIGEGAWGLLLITLGAVVTFTVLGARSLLGAPPGPGAWCVAGCAIALITGYSSLWSP